jgi:hypothetical protein
LGDFFVEIEWDCCFVLLCVKAGGWEQRMGATCEQMTFLFAKERKKWNGLRK